MSSASSFDYGNSVLKLSADLSPLSYFAPENWLDLNQSDADLGSVGPALLSNGMIFQLGKEGIGYLLRSANLGGIGGAAFTMNIESFQEKKYKATLAQQYDFSCGSAALATLLTYNYNILVGEQDVFKDMFDHGDKQVIAESGFSLLDIKNYLTRRGLESNGYRAPLEKLAGVRLPAIRLHTAISELWIMPTDQV